VSEVTVVVAPPTGIVSTVVEADTVLFTVVVWPGTVCVERAAVLPRVVVTVHALG